MADRIHDMQQKTPFFRFTLKRLVLAVACIAVLLAPLAWRKQLLQQQSHAVDELRAKGAVVWYRHEWDEFNQPTYQVVSPNNWLDYLLGENSSAEADFVSFVEYAGSSQELGALANLPYLKEVAFVHGSVDEELIDILCQIPNLETLNLSDTNVDDRALERLAQQPHLEYLNIMGSKVTPEGVRTFHAARPDCLLTVAPDETFMRWLQRLFLNEQE